MSRRYVWLGLLAIGCASGCAQNAWHSRDVAVEFAYRAEMPSLPILNPRLDVRPRVPPLVRDILVGEPVPVAFTVTNVSRHPIVLLRLEASQMPEVLYAWTHPVYGRLDYDENTETYTYTPDARVKSVYEFHSGFLFPGEKRTLSVDLRFRQSGELHENFSLVYCREPMERLRDDIFVMQEDPLAGSLRYVHPASAELDDWKKAQSRFGNIIFRSTGGGMFFSFGKEFEVRPVDFSLEQAVKKAGFQPENYDYTHWKKGWVLEKDGSVSVVTPTTVERHEGVTLGVFKFIESCKGYYLPAGVRLRQGSVPFHVWDEDVYVSVANVFSGYETTLARGHRIELPVDKVFGVIETLKTRGFRTFRTTFDGQDVLGVEPVK
jgi:hypothetical protein